MRRLLIAPCRSCRRRGGSGARRLRRGADMTAATRPPPRSRGDAATVSMEDSGTRAVSSWTRLESPTTRPTRKRKQRRCTGLRLIWILYDRRGAPAGAPSQANSASLSVGRNDASDIRREAALHVRRSEPGATGDGLSDEFDGQQSPGTSSASASPPTRSRTAMTPAARSAVESPVASTPRWAQPGGPSAAGGGGDAMSQSLGRTRLGSYPGPLDEPLRRQHLLPPGHALGREDPHARRRLGHPQPRAETRR